MGVFVKICGCATAEGVAAVSALKPDALGFILWPGSKRYVSLSRLEELLDPIPKGILKVGVFVDASQDEVAAAMERGLDVAQLHGQEEPAFVKRLPYRIWKAWPLNRPLAYSADQYDVEAFLLDHYGATQTGGTGQTLDWSQAAHFVAESGTKVILAGGLRPDNVQQAIHAVRPWGVDVSSGVEHEPGRKDGTKVREFMEQCRSAS